MHSQSEEEHAGTLPGKAASSALKALLVAAGTLAVALGVLGIFLPLLPTTPFLLLAAACYARSSSRFYRWLLGNRWFGEYIKSYREKRGVPVRVKAASLALLWAAILVSAFGFVQSGWVRLLLMVIALGVSAHILSLKTLRR